MNGMNDAAATRAAILRHAEKYPEAELQDFLKYLHQSSFGCEHLVADASAAAEWIRREAETAVPRAGATIEELDGPWCRVYLDELKNGLMAETFARLFALSAQPVPDGRERLENRLGVLLSMLRAGELPFDARGAEKTIQKWRDAGYPACHHSERFRECYAPAYRVLKTEYARYLPLFSAIDRQLAAGRNVITAIDGFCASGKTTLAELIRGVYGCSVFHMDDYFLRPEQRTPERFAEPGGNVDRERFMEEILTPVCAGRDVVYRPFDCATFTLKDPVTVKAAKLTVVEGSYSLHPYLRDAYTLRVFMKTGSEEQMRRIIRREGEEAADMFRKRWIPLEMAYYNAFRLDEKCDIVFED